MIELRAYTLDVVEAYATYRNNRTIFDNGYDKVPNPFTLKDAEDFITLQTKKNIPERKIIYWKDQFVGEIGITINTDVFKLGAEMGYFIGAPFWGNGIASEAIKLMVEYSFKNFDIIRIEAGVFSFNKASMRVLEKNDFYLESIKKDAVIKNNVILDDYIWVKLKNPRT
ncbi:GNAT family N-acetyltransferase [Cellulophaga sp. L1A9]|uniref:GNAT family N-acetyltransferase n=1 Tax=Cellulophaga sp. L1A9 TaxID=2686362 RepID=UPI00131D30DF|nr:GNAT family protein [Cellulophaga sp. L1A9]